MDELLAVLQDARLVGDAVAVARLGAALAEQLGVAEAGADAHGLWLRLDVTGASGEVASQRMRWCWPGRFRMGSPDTERGREPWEGPQHPVVLTRGSWLGETPVTQALWHAVMGDDPGVPIAPSHPVEEVSWHDGQRFCERLGRSVGPLSPQLPTEAQPNAARWSYAARAGSDAPAYGPLHDIAWSGEAPAEEHMCLLTYPTGLKQPNAWGLYDMLGNVYEWTTDRNAFEPEAYELAPYEPGERHDPICTVGSVRVIRGRSWVSMGDRTRAAHRDVEAPDNREDDLGLRLVLSLAPGAEPPPPAGVGAHT